MLFMRLELRGITKRFGSFTANDAIDLVVEPGEIHCLLGENGAGKSTLMNVLFGLYNADGGEILINGESVHFATSGDAVRKGIGMVHQHFMLVPVFTVAENVMLGFEPTKSFNRIDYTAASVKIRKFSEEFGLEVDPDAIVEELPVGIQQRVEILKALSQEAELLILDEPTAVLTPQEIESLIKIMKDLAASGKSILFISHKLKEVKAVADKITVIRLGKVVGTGLPSDSEEELASKMVGRSVNLQVEKSPHNPGAPMLEVKDLVVRDERGVTVVNNISFTVNRGEVLAVAGVQGNGQSELVEAIAGLRSVESGTISINGVRVDNSSPRECLDAGLAHIPEDRQRDGLVLSLSVADNLVLNTPRAPQFAGRGSRKLQAVRENAERLVKDFDIRTESVDAPVGSLSGGNQQKVIVARELSRNVDVLIAAQPTRGLDVGSIEYVHKQFIRERDSNKAVLLVSSELDEVFALADRIAVMFQGGITGIVSPDSTRESIGLLMAGITEQVNV